MIVKNDSFGKTAPNNYIKVRELTKEIKIALTDKIKNYVIIPQLKEALKIFPVVYLTGGAVIDIIDGRCPKDYDFLGFYETALEKLLDLGFVFVMETAYAYTYDFKGFKIQFLKKDISEFEFKISQAKYNIHTGELTLDRVSYENKLLIPANFTDPNTLVNAMLRIPHWEAKGYKMNIMTYKSVVGVLYNLKQENS